MATKSWREWPRSERTGGPPATPVDNTLLSGRWLYRNQTLAARPAVPGILIDDSIAASSQPTFVDFKSPGKIWVPPWALGHSHRVRVIVTGNGSAEGDLYVRMKLTDGFNSSLATISGDPTAVDVALHYSGASSSAIVTVTAGATFVAALRDQVVDCQWQYAFVPTSSSAFTIQLRYYAAGGARLPWWWDSIAA
jgi:hypothetical protein